MSQTLNTVEHWLGLCRKAPVLRMVPTVMPVQPDTGHSSPPDDGGPARIRKGLRITVSSTKTLLHNPQLLWFALLAGLVLAVHLAVQEILTVFSINTPSDLIGSPFVAFAVELPTVFFLMVLCAGLVLSLSFDEGNPVFFLCGLRRVRKYLVPLAGWSVVVAFAGTLLFTLGWTLASLSVPSWFHAFDIYGNLYTFLFVVFSQYPFNWSLNPEVLVTYLPGGAVLNSGVGFPIAFINTLVFLAINVLLVVLTLFVVPLLVLEKKHLKEAVSGSFALIKKIRGELAGCILCLGMTVFAASLTFLLFRFSGVDHVWWEAGAMYTSYSPPGDAWAAVGILYVIALSSLVLVVATVGGIAALDLYRHAKIRESEG